MLQKHEATILSYLAETVSDLKSFHKEKVLFSVSSKINPTCSRNFDK